MQQRQLQVIEAIIRRQENPVLIILEDFSLNPLIVLIFQKILFFLNNEIYLLILLC